MPRRWDLHVLSVEPAAMEGVPVPVGTGIVPVNLMEVKVPGPPPTGPVNEPVRLTKWPSFGVVAPITVLSSAPAVAPAGGEIGKVRSPFAGLKRTHPIAGRRTAIVRAAAKASAVTQAQIAVKEFHWQSPVLTFVGAPYVLRPFWRGLLEL